MMRTMGIITNVTMVRRQEAENMNTSTMAAWVEERSMTFRLRQIWSLTVVVSADRRLVISPVLVVSKKPASCRARQASTTGRQAVRQAV
jgi:hypothetical protein